MDDLLTARHVQDLLKVDRTTIYRMLKDGRLTGVKVGQQWRFPRADVQALLSGDRAQPANDKPPSSVLPIACLQPVQDVFADMAEVGAVITAPDGVPLTDMSNSCAFCSQILASESGRRACIASWRALASQADRQPQFVTCHAGLQYARARIEVNGELVGMLIAGQFYTEAPDAQEQEARVRKLAQQHQLDAAALREAAAHLAVLDGRMQTRIGMWLQRVARTFEHVGQERVALLNRLRRIAAMSSIDVLMDSTDRST